MKDKPAFTWKNWWYYNKWFVIFGIAAALSIAGVVAGNLNRVKPDYQIAYIGTYPLSEETASSVETALAAAGKDLNGDGKVVFRLNQYPTAKNADPEIALGQVGWETQLMADLLDCESYFFLLEDAEEFNYNYDILDEAEAIILASGFKGDINELAQNIGNSIVIMHSSIRRYGALHNERPSHQPVFSPLPDPLPDQSQSRYISSLHPPW